MGFLGKLRVLTLVACVPFLAMCSSLEVEELRDGEIFIEGGSWEGERVVVLTPSTPELIIGETDIGAGRERSAWEVEGVFATLESPIELPKSCLKLFVADFKGADGVVVEWADPPAEECEPVEGLDVMVGAVRYQGWRCAYDWGIHVDWREVGAGCED